METTDAARAFCQAGKWPPGCAGLTGGSDGRKARRLLPEPDLGALEDTEQAPGETELMKGEDVWTMRRVGHEVWGLGREDCIDLDRRETSARAPDWGRDQPEKAPA